MVGGPLYQIAAGPPAKRPRKMADLPDDVRDTQVIDNRIEANLTPPIKFKAQKLAAKLSTRCQVL